MIRSGRLAAALLAAACVAAGEAPAVPPAAVPASAATVAPANPNPGHLGVNIDLTSSNFDGGLPVASVGAGTAAAAMGIFEGDRLVACNGKPLAKPDDLKALLATARAGDPVTVEVLRGKERLVLSGVLGEKPKPVTVSAVNAQANELERKVRALQEKNREPTLAEILAMVRSIEDRLPKAAAEFKKQYPDGDFKIKIEIEITSDRKAKDPLEITNEHPKATPDGAKPKPDDGKPKPDGAKPQVDDAKPRPPKAP